MDNNAGQPPFDVAAKPESAVAGRTSQTFSECIVISLKDIFYEHSNSLVGICRDVGTNSSRTLTLDLTPFNETTEAASPVREQKRARSLDTGKEARGQKRPRSLGAGEDDGDEESKADEEEEDQDRKKKQTRSTRRSRRTTA